MHMRPLRESIGLKKLTILGIVSAFIIIGGFSAAGTPAVMMTEDSDYVIGVSTPKQVDDEAVVRFAFTSNYSEVTRIKVSDTDTTTKYTTTITDDKPVAKLRMENPSGVYQVKVFSDGQVIDVFAVQFTID